IPFGIRVVRQKSSPRRLREHVATKYPDGHIRISCVRLACADRGIKAEHKPHLPDRERVPRLQVLEEASELVGDFVLNQPVPACAFEIEVEHGCEAPALDNSINSIRNAEIWIERLA